MKKAIFCLLLLLCFVLLLEGAGVVGLRMLNGRWVSASEVVAELAGADDAPDLPGRIRATGRMPTYMQQHILHPYIGFVRNPEIKQHEFVERAVPFPVNEYGFFGPTPLVKRSPDRFRIYVTGGSVALEFFIDAKEYFEQLVGAFPEVEGKTVEVISLALGGMKQPQQVLVLNYLLSLGAEPDMVIALDGFNEVVLPVVENVPFGVNPFFPRKWNVYGSTSLDLEAAVLVGAIALRREDVDVSRQFIRGSILCKSRLGVALWQAAHRKKAIRRTESEQALQAYLQQASEKLPPQLTGPPVKPMDKDELAEACVDVWLQASRQTWELCRDHGIVFMQFLQPNQYVADSKVLTPWEEQHALSDPAWVWRIAARIGYPVLMARGPELAAYGEPYADLTDVFEDVPETVYKDICCHLNPRGAELVAERIAAELPQALAAAEAAR